MSGTSLVPVELPIVGAYYRKGNRLADVIAVDPEHARAMMEDAVTGLQFPLLLTSFKRDWQFVWQPPEEDPRS